MNTAFPLFPQELHVDLTAGCNARCVMCSVHEDTPNPELASDTLINRLVNLAPIVKSFRIGCSSESLMHPDILDTVRRLKAAGSRVQILTNGKLLADAAEDLCETGLDVLRVSLDSLDAHLLESRRRGIRLNNILDGLRRVEAWKKRHSAKFPDLGLAVTLMRDNLAELPALMAFCAEAGIRILDYGQVFVWRIDSALVAKSLFLAKEETNACVARAEELARAYGIYFHPRYFGSRDILYTNDIQAEPHLQDVNFSFASMSDCTVHARDAWINHRGDVMLCNRYNAGNIVKSAPGDLFSASETVRIMTARGNVKTRFCNGCTNCYIRPPDDIRGHFAPDVIEAMGQEQLCNLAARNLTLSELEHEVGSVLSPNKTRKGKA